MKTKTQEIQVGTPTLDEARWASFPNDAPNAADWTGFQTNERKLAVPKRLLEASTNEFIASTEREGRDGDIIEQKSWRLSDYRRNPVVLDNHFGNNIGRTETVRVVENELHALIRWDDSDENPDGRRAARAHREGWRNAVSVRWITGIRTARNTLPEDHPHYSKGRQVAGFFGEPITVVGDLLTRCTLLEISSVDVPGDANALQTRFFGSANDIARKVSDDSARRDVLQALDEMRANGTLVDALGLRSLVNDVLKHELRTDDGLRDVLLARLDLSLQPTTKVDTPPTIRTLWAGSNSKD